MKLANMNWMQVEAYLRQDDRVVLPLGGTEQHGHLSLATSAFCAVRIADDAAQPLGIPVCPVLSYGLSPAFMAYPGTITFRPQTFALIIADLLASLAECGFRRVLIVNGARGNGQIREVVAAWGSGRPGMEVIFHDWWSAPRTAAKIARIDPIAGHGSWVENFPWTRLPGVVVPDMQKALVEIEVSGDVNPTRLRRRLGDGTMGGYYERDDHEMMDLWAVAVQETRELLSSGWRSSVPAAG